RSWLLVVRCFVFTSPATTEIYTLSLHDALPISDRGFGTDFAAAGADHAMRRQAAGADLRAQLPRWRQRRIQGACLAGRGTVAAEDRKSTRLNSSHVKISYAVFCLKKKKKEHESP